MTVQPTELRVPELNQLKHRLRISREEAGFEIGELAEALGTARHTISRAEKGLSKPRRSLLIAWAWQTRVPVEWLETGEAPTDDGGGSPGDSSQLPRLDSNQQPLD
ncbi:helix-turn-helix transcriptional regulator, partial [Nesterenkonia sp.]|uniref:helix-turn-helix domain-containing protein n=1 Tax=Nesterenkonia sp. TaxID=704201 RepID=UPI0026020741